MIERLDEHTTFSAYTDTKGKRWDGDFAIMRMVGDLGYIHTAALSGRNADGTEIVVPLSSVLRMEVAG